MAKKLLYAENRASVKKEINKFIKKYELEAVEVTTSQELLVKAVEWYPDCIITGHTPPFLNAFDICAYKKYDSLLSRLPMVVIISPEDKASARMLRNGKNVRVASKPEIEKALKESLFKNELTMVQELMLDQPSLDPLDRVISKALESSGKYFEAESARDYVSESHFNSESFEKSVEACFINLANIIDLKVFLLCFSLPQGLFVFIKTAKPVPPNQMALIKEKLYSHIPEEVLTETKDKLFECFLTSEGESPEKLNESLLKEQISHFADTQGFRGCAGIITYRQDLEYVESEHEDLIDKLLGASFLSLEHTLLRERLNLLQTIDPLTSIKNRANIIESLKREFVRAKRYGDNLSLFILDINDFSLINTLYGYRAGDLVLKEIAEIIQKSIRAIDDVGRYSSDKYLVILPETKMEDSEHVVSRIKNNIFNHKFDGIAKDIEVTVTTVVASFEPRTDSDLQTLLDRLEDLLDEVKAKDSD